MCEGKARRVTCELCFSPPPPPPRVKKKEGEKEEELKEDEREPRERRCFQCGDMGHVRRDCPDYRHLRQRAPGGPGTQA